MSIDREGLNLKDDLDDAVDNREGEVDNGNPRGGYPLPLLRR